MTTVTTTTYSPVVQPAYNYAPVAQPIPGAQPVYAPALAQAQMPVVALSYTAGTSLPESQGIVTSLDTHRPAVCGFG